MSVGSAIVITAGEVSMFDPTNSKSISRSLLRRHAEKSTVSAKRAPNPSRLGFPSQRLSHRAQIKRLPPREFHRFEIQPPAPRLVNQPPAKFAIAQNQSALRLQRKLSANHIVRQRARPEQKLH